MSAPGAGGRDSPLVPNCDSAPRDVRETRASRRSEPGESKGTSHPVTSSARGVRVGGMSTGEEAWRQGLCAHVCAPRRQRLGLCWPEAGGRRRRTCVRGRSRLRSARCNRELLQRALAAGTYSTWILQQASATGLPCGLFLGAFLQLFLERVTRTETDTIMRSSAGPFHEREELLAYMHPCLALTLTVAAWVRVTGGGHEPGARTGEGREG